MQRQYQEAIRNYLLQTILSTLDNMGQPPILGIPVSIADSLIIPDTFGNYFSVLKTRLTPNSIDLTIDSYKKGKINKKFSYSCLNYNY